MPSVRSAANPRVREALALLASARERRKRGLLVLEGAHLVEAYRARFGAPQALIVTEEAQSRAEVRALVAATAAAQVVTLPASLLAGQASVPPDVGVLGVVAAPPSPVAAFPALSLLLEDVQDPGNVGTIVRTAAAAGVAQVLLSPGSASAWSPKALRAGQGAQFLAALVEDADLVAWTRAFRDRGGRVAALVVREGTPIHRAGLTGPLALAVGNEGAGLTRAMLDAASLAVTIPMARDSESLNAAAAAAVALFEARRQRAQD